jgi:hypothetical protein
VRRWRSRPAASSPTAPMPSSPSNLLSRMTTASRFHSLLARVTTYVPAVVTCARAISSCRAARSLARRRSARWRPPASTVFVVPGARGWPFSPPGRSYARPASRSGRGRSTRRTAFCLRPRSPPRALSWSGFRLSPTTRPRIAPRSNAGSTPTCS